ncbi:chemotaxis protein CheW [Frigidibacter sp. MR17.24]|uniref:chemotaxis protein CheW n=1 Tax=Frigidibacter sp. MR17.24 TaxID=3127345 RepID=UPI003012DC27
MTAARPTLPAILPAGDPAILSGTAPGDTAHALGAPAGVAAPSQTAAPGDPGPDPAPNPAPNPAGTQPAPAEAGPGAAPRRSPLALIDLGTLTIGIDVADLREVMVAPRTLEPFRSSAEGVVGCVALRGQVIPVVDIAPMLGLPPLYPATATGADGGVVVIVGASDEVYGILARVARQIVAPRDIARQSITGGGSAACDRLLPEVVLIDGRVVAILDTTVLPAAGLPLSHAQRAERRSRDAAGQYLVFEVQGLSFCLSLDRIQATIPETRVDPEVLRSGACDGSIAAHGIDRALIALPPLLGMAPASTRPDRAAAVVLPFPDGSSIALRADRVRDIRALAAAQIGPMPAMLCARPDIVTGAFVDDRGHEFYLLDGPALTADPMLAELARLERRDGVTVDTGAPPPARAAAAAVPPLGAAAGGPRAAALLMRSGIACALAVSDVEEIISLPPQLQRDLGPSAYLGTIASRGRQLLPVFSLAALYGHEADGRKPHAAIVLVDHRGGTVGLMVEEICAIETMAVIAETDGGTATLQRLAPGDAGFWQRLSPETLPLHAG